MPPPPPPLRRNPGPGAPVKSDALPVYQTRPAHRCRAAPRFARIRYDQDIAHSAQHSTPPDAEQLTQLIQHNPRRRPVPGRLCPVRSRQPARQTRRLAPPPAFRPQQRVRQHNRLPIPAYRQYQAGPLPPARTTLASPATVAVSYATRRSPSESPVVGATTAPSAAARLPLPSGPHHPPSATL